MKLDGLFKRFAIPPSSAHEVVQDAARRAGWRAPWDYEQQKTKAGKASGASRRGLAEIRLSLVAIARKNLNPALRRSPYSDRAGQALEDEYRQLFNKTSEDAILSAIFSVISSEDREKLACVSRDTLNKDLKKIRQRHGVRRK
ncbi:MAG TPA: hypothetical protein VK430_04000 [Xanthobacteraceae bacterium]|nr:hypothetical protein [Xanthobacteraceae bacterium]